MNTNLKKAEVQSMLFADYMDGNLDIPSLLKLLKYLDIAFSPLD